MATGCCSLQFQLDFLELSSLSKWWTIRRRLNDSSLPSVVEFVRLRSGGDDDSDPSREVSE